MICKEGEAVKSVQLVVGAGCIMWPQPGQMVAEAYTANCTRHCCCRYLPPLLMLLLLLSVVVLGDNWPPWR